MRKAKVIQSRSAGASGSVLLLAAWAFAAAVRPSLAHELKEIGLFTAGGRTHLELTFASGLGEGEYPLYFQKADPDNGSIVISFLETETVFPLGRQPLDPNSPGIEEMLLKKVTTPSGKNFLGLELKYRQPPQGDAILEPDPKGVLKIPLGPGKGKYAWSLSNVLKAGDAYLSAGAEAAPHGAAIPEAKPAGNSAPAGVPSVAPAGGKTRSAAVADAPEGMPSAFAEGEILESGHAGKGLTSSRIFSPGPGEKAMIMYKDSAALRAAPGAKGAIIRKIPIGDRLVRLDAKPGWLRVVSGSDTGFVRTADAVYEDELTKVQEKTIQGRIEAKQAMIAAAEAKAAAAEARAAAAKARKEEKIRHAEELAQRKAAEKAAADSAKALAKARAAEEAARIKEAQALAASGGAAVDGNPGEAGRGGSSGPGEPKLAIADNPELAAKLAQEKLAAEEEKKRIEPEENRVSYNSYGRRDPFIPVEQGSMDNGIDIDQMKVVGIIWQAQQPMAVLEHNREAGVSFTIKEGDPVHNGHVARITRDAVTFDISEYGISRSYSLKLVSSKEGAK